MSCILIKCTYDKNLEMIQPLVAGIMSCIRIKCTYDKNLEMIQLLVGVLALFVFSVAKYQIGPKFGLLGQVT
jgi:hypothetical protein